MLIGYNNDVQYRGKEFHIQTEDHGTSTAKIESQLFHSGQILDTKFVDYQDVLDEHPDAEHEEKIEELMRSVHVGLYQQLMDGEYDEMVGLDPTETPDDVEAPDPDEFTPAQERVPAAAAKVEEGGQDALEDFHAQEANKHSDLDSLKDKLGDVDDESAEEESLSDPEITLSDSSDSEAVSGAATTEKKESRDSPAEDVAGDDGDDVSRTDAAESLREQLAVRDAGESSETDGLDPSVLELPSTGVSTWEGCEEPTSDLGIDSLVEAQFE